MGHNACRLPLAIPTMLSYRRGFHAGNHADVLKHTALVALLRLLTRKNKTLLGVDTHAGAELNSISASGQ